MITLKWFVFYNSPTWTKSKLYTFRMSIKGNYIVLSHIRAESGQNLPESGMILQEYDRMSVLDTA